MSVGISHSDLESRKRGGRTDPAGGHKLTMAVTAVTMWGIHKTTQRRRINREMRSPGTKTSSTIKSRSQAKANEKEKPIRYGEKQAVGLWK